MISLSKALSRAYQRDAKTKWEISPPPPQPLFAVVRFCLFQELMILFSEAYEIQASKNIQNNWDHKKARYKLVFSITIKIKRPIFWSHAHGKEFIQMYKCLPSVVQSLKTVLKKVIMSHRYKFSHFILPCDINILLFSFAKMRESKEFCTTKVSRFHLLVPLAVWTWARQGGESSSIGHLAHDALKLMTVTPPPPGTPLPPLKHTYPSTYLCFVYADLLRASLTGFRKNHTRRDQFFPSFFSITTAAILVQALWNLKIFKPERKVITPTK